MVCIPLPQKAPKIFESIFHRLMCAPAVATPPPPPPTFYQIFKSTIQKYGPAVLVLEVLLFTFGYLYMGYFIESRFRTTQQGLEASGILPSKESRQGAEYIEKYGKKAWVHKQVQDSLAEARARSRAKNEEKEEQLEGRLVKATRRVVRMLIPLAPTLKALLERAENTLVVAMEGVQKLATGAYKGQIETKYMMHESKFVQTILFYGPHAKQARWARKHIKSEKEYYERMAALARTEDEEREREALGEEFELVD
jgi:hypothetical protein